MTEDLLARAPDLVGLYLSGGGITGAMEAIAASGRAGKLVVVGHEMMEPTRTGLIDGILTMVIAHPTARMIQEAMDATCDAATGLLPGQHVIGFDIYTAENIQAAWQNYR